MFKRKRRTAENALRKSEVLSVATKLSKQEVAGKKVNVALYDAKAA
jgi:hypothetical protein